MDRYRDKEIKVLNVSVKELCKKLEGIGAVKVFDWSCTRISYDNNSKSLIRNGIEIRITEEGETKLSLDENKNGERTSIKLKISRTHEMEDFLAKLNIKPISKIYSYRISYEFDGIDFDIDQFPEIPAFVEIDLGDSTISIDSLLKHLSLENNEVFEGSTIKLYEKYNKDYLSLFSLS